MNQKHTGGYRISQSPTRSRSRTKGTGKHSPESKDKGQSQNQTQSQSQSKNGGRRRKSTMRKLRRMKKSRKVMRGGKIYIESGGINKLFKSHEDSDNLKTQFLKENNVKSLSQLFPPGRKVDTTEEANKIVKNGNYTEESELVKLLRNAK